MIFMGQILMVLRRSLHQCKEGSRLKAARILQTITGEYIFVQSLLYCLGLSVGLNAKSSTLLGRKRKKGNG